MYKAPSKSKQVRKLIVIYTAMVTAVVALVTLLVLVMLGYRFNGEDHRIEQTGLVQFDSSPRDATIEIDKKTLSRKTNAKSVVTPGVHEFAIWREGYETWWKELSIQAGTVTWLNYARLVPKERPVEAVQAFEQMDDILFSPAGQFAMVHLASDKPEFALMDLRDSEDVKRQDITLPDSSISKSGEEGVTHRYELKEWDQSGRYVLVIHYFNDTKEWLLIDRESPETTENISSIVNLPIDSAQLSGTDGDNVYILTGGTVRLANLSSGNLSRSFVSNVEKFSVYGTDIITYVGAPAQNTNERILGVVRKDDKQPNIIRTVAAGESENLSITTARYYNKNYVVVSVGASVEILAGDYSVGKDEQVTLPVVASFTTERPVKWLQMSGNGRFIIAQDELGYTSYDLERTAVAGPVLFDEPMDQQLHWLDNYNVRTSAGGQLTMREFDGANGHMLMPADAQYDASFDRTFSYVYAVQKVENTFQLQRVRMILPQ